MYCTIQSLFLKLQVVNNMKEYFASRTVDVTQSLSDFGLKLGDDGKLVRLDGSRIKTNAAFKEWIYKLKAGERLPRGRYFKNKRPGK
ncbi:hypothetical protein GRK09_004469, partial [Salmonella enterica]|nr:hypothetical protein [Salmonella enterica]